MEEKLTQFRNWAGAFEKELSGATKHAEKLRHSLTNLGSRRMHAIKVLGKWLEMRRRATCARNTLMADRLCLCEQQAEIHRLKLANIIIQSRAAHLLAKQGVCSNEVGTSGIGVADDYSALESGSGGAALRARMVEEVRLLLSLAQETKAAHKGQSDTFLRDRTRQANAVNQNGALLLGRAREITDRVVGLESQLAATVLDYTKLRQQVVVCRRTAHEERYLEHCRDQRQKEEVASVVSRHLEVARQAEAAQRAQLAKVNHLALEQRRNQAKLEVMLREQWAATEKLHERRRAQLQQSAKESRRRLVALSKRWKREKEGFGLDAEALVARLSEARVSWSQICIEQARERYTPVNKSGGARKNTMKHKQEGFQLHINGSSRPRASNIDSRIQQLRNSICELKSAVSAQSVVAEMSTREP